MSRLGDELSSSLEELESDLDCPQVTWSGADYPCIPNTLRRGTLIVLGGVEVEIQFTLIIRTDELSGLAVTAWPSAGKTVMFDSKTYRVASARTPASGATLELDLIDPAR